MDYKKIIPSRNLRIKILKWFRWIPDKSMVKIQYRIHRGRKLDLKNPKRFTEKLQWYKLFYRNDDMRRCVDKYDVRSFVEERGLGNILNLCYGVYESFDKIDFDSLPKSFVIKDTLGGGGNSVIIINDKSAFVPNEYRPQIEKWTKQGKYPSSGREWVYDKRSHRIIIEKLIQAEKPEGLYDYKFFCFNGEVAFIYVIWGRKLGNGAQFAILDKNWNDTGFLRADEFAPDHIPDKPANYKELEEIAKCLSKGFPHVRVDLYNEFNQPIFGELTFFDGSGYMSFSPDEADYKLGEFFELPEKTR